MSRFCAIIRARLRGERGFTLLELLIVVNILGILTLIALPSFQVLKGRAQDGANKSNVRTALTAINAYFQDNQTYSGLSIAAMQSFDAGLNPATYTLTAVTATSYCIQSPQGTTAHVWRRNGPGALLEKSHC